MAHGPVMIYTATSVAFTLLSFPNLMLPAALWGLIRGRRLGIPLISYWSLVAATTIHLGFVLRYAVIDQYTFLMPVYALVAVFAGVGFADVLQRWTPSVRRWIIGLSVVSLALTPAVYPAAYGVTRRFHLLGRYARNKPYRDDYRYLFIPWGRGENSAEQMSSTAISLASPNGLILIEDPMAYFAVEYQRVVHHEPQLDLLPESEGRELKDFVNAQRPVVLIPYSPAHPPADPARGHWSRIGDLYELKVKAAAHPVDAVTEPQRKER
jgi:hypothetical protein